MHGCLLSAADHLFCRQFGLISIRKSDVGDDAAQMYLTLDLNVGPCNSRSQWNDGMNAIHACLRSLDSRFIEIIGQVLIFPFFVPFKIQPQIGDPQHTYITTFAHLNLQS